MTDLKDNEGTDHHPDVTTPSELDFSPDYIEFVNWMTDWLDKDFPKGDPDRGVAMLASVITWYRFVMKGKET